MTMTGVRSLPDMFLRRVAASPDRDAFVFPTDPGWGRYTWKDAGERVRAIACGLRSLGVELEERCAILAATRIEWVLVDFGIMCAGGATTTIYPSNTAEECAFILTDAHCVVALVENEQQLAKLEQHRHELPHVRKVVLIDGAAPDNPWTMTLTHLMEAGRAWDQANPGAYEARIAQITPAHLATLLYTSGTTGRQKGVELIHDCWLYEAEAIEALDLLRPEDLQYLWLPLSHSFGKVLESCQIRIGFVSAVDGRVEKLVENLGEVKPTFVAAVPRVFEKVHSKVVIGAQEAGGLKLKIFRWAFAVGHQVSKLRQEGREPAGLLALQNALADRLVFSKLRARFGGRLRFFISGSAALSREVAEFFHAADILIAEGYGLTETSAATFVNWPLVNRQSKAKFGTVGPPMPGTEVKIAPEDGEVLIRGRGVMRGYHNLPDATRETIDPDGWLRTGDIGVLDAENFLKLTDRKKDLIKTSGGKYVAPQALEGKVKAACPYVNQVLVHGDGRNYCSALVTLDEEAVRNWLKDNGGAEGLTIEQLAGDARVVKLVQGYVDEVNQSLASYETIKKFAILPADFTVDAGELTASLKVKRKVVEQKYRQVLDRFYEDARIPVAR
jgi:long-chain acyl-CoA synthetase